MRVGLCATLLVLAGGFASAAEDEIHFTLTEPRSLLVRPATRPADSLVEAKIEPTKHELRFDDVLAAERWEQGFQLAARLPVDEAWVIRQEFRAGVQSETVLADEFTTASRDALAMLEKTALEVRASEALRVALLIQQQRLANNSIPFAEIVTYGTEIVVTPVKTTVLKLQVEAQQRDEFAATESTQEMARLSVEQELVPKQLKASAAASLTHAADREVADQESLAQKLEAAVQWSPLAATAFSLGAELATRDALAGSETVETYALKLQQRFLTRSTVELQAGYEQRTQEALDAFQQSGAWNLGAHSDFALREDWTAGLGVRYRLRQEAVLPAMADELSLTLSLKGRF